MFLIFHPQLKAAGFERGRIWASKGKFMWVPPKNRKSVNFKKSSTCPPLTPLPSKKLPHFVCVLLQV